MPRLRVMFPKPSLFLVDARLTVLLDGGLIYDGSFKAGVDVAGEAAPGVHMLLTRIDADIAIRSREYRLELDGAVPAYVATLNYSRFWGNFTKRLALFPQR